MTPDLFPRAVRDYVGLHIVTGAITENMQPHEIERLKSKLLELWDAVSERPAHIDQMRAAFEQGLSPSDTALYWIDAITPMLMAAWRRMKEKEQ